MLVYWSVKVGDTVSKIATKVRVERNTRTEKEQHRLLTKPHSRRRFRFRRLMLLLPIASMGLVYLPTFWLIFLGFHVGKYTSPMDALCNGKNPPLRPRIFLLEASDLWLHSFGFHLSTMTTTIVNVLAQKIAWNLAFEQEFLLHLTGMHNSKMQKIELWTLKSNIIILIAQHII